MKENWEGGPWTRKKGEWAGIEIVGSDAVFHYTLRGGSVKESYKISNDSGSLKLIRTITLQGIRDPLALVVSDLGKRKPEVELDGADLSLIDKRYVVARIDAASGGDASFVLATDLETGAISLKKEEGG